MTNTYSTKASDIKREWHVIDASDKILGKVATEAAGLLMGKHKAIFCRHLDTGDYVVILNAEKIKVTGAKTENKKYYRHSQYPGGLKSPTYAQVLEQHPTRIIEHAVKGMLPHNRLQAQAFKRLKVFAGSEHPYGGQVKPAKVETKEKAAEA